MTEARGGPWRPNSHLVVCRDFHNGTAGLSTVGGACRPAQNSGFISLLNHGQDTPLNQSVVTLAHELAHSLGAKHDDDEEVCRKTPSAGVFIVVSAAEGERLRL